MAAIQSIVDRSDGTGADVHLVSGFDADDIVLHVARYTGPWNSLAFAVLGTKVSESQIALPITDLGAYVVAVMHEGEPDEVRGFRITDEVLALHLGCMQELRTHVLALALPGVHEDPNRHVIHYQPRYSLRDLGGDLNDYEGVHYWPLSERRAAADNVRDEVVYPVQVAIVRGTGGEVAVQQDWFLSRQILSSSFLGCPLPSLADIFDVRVVPAAIHDSSAASLNVDLQSLIFDCYTHQARVIT